MSKNSNKKGISVIIPCYNVENYIKKCLDNLENKLQNFDYEIILVDDCSTDNTKEIIKSIIKSKKIIFLENEENHGAGYSRNLALQKAKYDYISFIDADDFIDDNFYDEMMKQIKKEKADVVACDIKMVYEDSSLDFLHCCCDFVPSKYNLINTGLAASPCNKIIKKEYLLKYPFAEGIMNEDVPCILSIIANCEKVTYTSKTKYNYVQHLSSVQNSPLSDKRLDIFKAIDLFEQRIKGNKEYNDFMESVVFLQIICFLLYVHIKEKNVLVRGKFLKKFNKLASKYNIRKNRFYYNFVNSKNLKTRIYYKITNKLICNGFGYSASLFMCTYDFFKWIKNKKRGLKKSVIKNNITIDMLIKVCVKNQKINSTKTVSVVIPNYNYARFLYQRVYSILKQNYKINELIILDDCSKDSSIEVIDSIVNNLKKYMKITKVYNKTNSGSVFKQWKKALELSSSDYLWIAEADDYCDKKMLSSIMKLIEQDSEITLGYVDTAYIEVNGAKILKTIKPEIDIMKTGHWNSNFINDGKDEIKSYAFLNCTIANVSSVIFKKEDYSDIFKELVNYKQVGDYLFYLSVMERGKVAFVNKPLNYYRVHGDNVTSTTKKQLHFEELQRVHKILDSKYHFNKKQKYELQKRYKFLIRVWNLNDESDA